MTEKSERNDRKAVLGITQKVHGVSYALNADVSVVALNKVAYLQGAINMSHF